MSSRQHFTACKKASAVFSCWWKALRITPSICWIRPGASSVGIRARSASKVTKRRILSARISSAFIPSRTGRREFRRLDYAPQLERADWRPRAGACARMAPVSGLTSLSTPSLRTGIWSATPRLRGTSPSAEPRKPGCVRRRKWRRLANSPAAPRMILITCSWPFSAVSRSCANDCRTIRGCSPSWTMPCRGRSAVHL